MTTEALAKYTVEHSEVEESERDADNLKPHMANYLQTIIDLVAEHSDDLVELRRIQTQINADYNTLSTIATHVNDCCQGKELLNARHASLSNALKSAIGVRKE